MRDGTVSEMLAASFAARGVKRIFGVPGGGSSLDVIEAAAAAGIDFVLTRTESAAVMMAAVTAELSGTIGVALMTKGPGTASAVNGVAYASLDRAPVAVLTDGFSATEERYVTHQVFDQRAMLAPVTKGSSRLNEPNPAEALCGLIDLALSHPPGPVLIELTSEIARSRLSWNPGADVLQPPLATPTEPDVDRARDLLVHSARPVIVVGLEARDPASALAIRDLVQALKCPVFATYKGKGIIDDRSAQYIGEFTSGAAEANGVGAADLIILVGLDPVELLRQPWRYTAPVIDIACIRHPVHYLKPAVGLYGPLSVSIERLREAVRISEWTLEEMRSLRQGFQSVLSYRTSHGIGPQDVVEIAAEVATKLPQMPRATVDAGAHMFSAIAFWPCAAPNDILISNGLATMAFALPAAIAAALENRERAVIAFTGDGGLFMCIGELSTAVQQSVRIVVVVFNDESLSLIDIKQQQRGLAVRGVRWLRPDFAAAMRGMGGRGYRVTSVAAYRAALAEALDGAGPALIDVVIDPSGYPDQLKALRG